jgi:hypothetical protein
MKNLVSISFGIVWLLAFFCSCQDAPTAIPNDLTVRQATGELEKPPAGQRTCSLVVTPHDPLAPVTLPQSPELTPNPVNIHYEISCPYPITSATIFIIYDDNKDGNFNISHAERVRVINIACDGTQRTMTGNIGWNGEVDAAYSANGYLFDHFASENPDQYLFNFSVFDSRGGFASNGAGTSPDSARAYVVSPPTVPEFHIASVAPSSTPKKGKYIAELKTTVTCASEGAAASLGFTGSGYWVQIDTNGDEHTPSVYSGSLSCSFVDDSDEDAAGTTAAALQVGPGTYRYYATVLMYSPNYSYKPALNVTSCGDITVH